MTFRSGYNDAWETPGWTAQNQAYPPPGSNILVFPTDVVMVTITGHFRAGDGGRANGWVYLDNQETILQHVSTKENVAPIKVPKVEIKDGVFSVTVPATDSTLLTPDGSAWGYHLRITVSGRPFVEAYDVELPAVNPDVDVFDLVAPTNPPEPVADGGSPGSTTPDSTLDGGTP